MRNKQFILWFNELTIKDVPLVGGKNASLGEMYQALQKKQLRFQMVLLLQPMPINTYCLNPELRIR